MYVFLERIHIKPESRAALLKAGAEFIETTRAEKGCLHAGFYQDTMDENAYTFVEEWETRDDFNAHMGAVMSSSLVGVLGDATDQPSSVMLHEVAKSEKLGA